MGAGDSDASPAQHQRSEGGAAVQHAKASTLGLGELGIVFPDGRRCDDRTGIPQLCCGMTHIDPRTRGPQRPQIGRVLPIAAADRDAELQECCRDAIHP